MTYVAHTLLFGLRMIVRTDDALTGAKPMYKKEMNDMETVSRYDKASGRWMREEEIPDCGRMFVPDPDMTEIGHPRPNDIRVSDMLYDALNDIMSEGVGIREVRYRGGGNSGEPSIIIAMEDGDDVTVKIHLNHNYYEDVAAAKCRSNTQRLHGRIHHL